MNHILRTALVVAVAVAAYAGTAHFRNTAEPTQAELTQELDRIGAEAAKQHPGMAKTDAMKAVITEESAKKMTALSTTQRTSLAADMFWGFYFANTMERVRYCGLRGVDITPYANAFTQAHQDELSRAQAIYASAGVDPRMLYDKIQPQLAQMIEQDMKDVTAGAKVPLDQACGLFNAHAEAIAKFIALPPHVRQALMQQ